MTFSNNEEKDTISGDVVVVSQKDRIFCNGNGKATGHPGVYLAIPKDKNTVECPYCDRLFEYMPESKEE